MEDIVKYRHVYKEKKLNECEIENKFLGSVFSGAWTPNCWDLFLDVKCRKALHLELLGQEDWDSVVKYRHVNKEKK